MTRDNDEPILLPFPLPAGPAEHPDESHRPVLFDGERPVLLPLVRPPYPGGPPPGRPAA